MTGARRAGQPGSVEVNPAMREISSWIRVSGLFVYRQVIWDMKNQRAITARNASTGTSNSTGR